MKRLINEPSAAALYHSHAALREEQRLLIVDFGGGTLDVSVVDCFENMVEIVAIAGNNRLGGNDIDRAIAAYFCHADRPYLAHSGLPSSSGSCFPWQSEGKSASPPRQETTAASWPAKSVKRHTVRPWTGKRCGSSVSPFFSRSKRSSSGESGTAASPSLPSTM